MGHALSQVYKFERLQPLSYYAAAEQSQPMGGILWGARDNGEEALRARCQMVRQAPCMFHTLTQLALPFLTTFSLSSVTNNFHLMRGSRGLVLPRQCRIMCV